MSDKPSPAELYERAGGDRERYIALMWEHGYLVEGPREPLPCGWPGPVTEVREYGDEVSDEGGAHG